MLTVLAGSLRIEAQKRIREELQGIEMAVVIVSILHAIATGNQLPTR
ncbi:MAG TPA: hypothetical protein VGL94_21285 [Ktedonobacteraceae bacterium]|jgi:hypothetical protein